MRSGIWSTAHNSRTLKPAVLGVLGTMLIGILFNMLSPRLAAAEDAVSISPVDGRAGGRCLDADLGSIGQNGTKVQLWQCWQGLNQAWVVMPSAANPSFFSIKNAQSGRCLDLLLGEVRFPRAGNLVVLSDCRLDSLSQQWHWDLQVGFASLVTVLGGISGRGFCLDADAGTIGQNGTKMQIWDCWGGPNQQWQFSNWPVAVNCDPQFTVSGLFWQRYIGDDHWVAPGHDLGCPESNEINHPNGNGRYQQFQHGAMAFSPATGPESVQIGFVRNGVLWFYWRYTKPFHYDKFNVRGSRNKGTEFQQDAGASDGGTSGVWTSSGHLDSGVYELKVEGCDTHGAFPDSCNQGFSLPVYVTYFGG
jgi:hypothetical protein